MVIDRNGHAIVDSADYPVNAPNVGEALINAVVYGQHVALVDLDALLAYVHQLAERAGLLGHKRASHATHELINDITTAKVKRNSSPVPKHR
jgi:hypothetical protein